MRSWRCSSSRGIKKKRRGLVARGAKCVDGVEELGCFRRELHEALLDARCNFCGWEVLDRSLLGLHVDEGVARDDILKFLRQVYRCRLKPVEPLCDRLPYVEWGERLPDVILEPLLLHRTVIVDDWLSLRKRMHAQGGSVHDHIGSRKDVVGRNAWRLVSG